LGIEDVVNDLVFIAYSDKDIDTVRDLYRRLSIAGYNLWFGDEDLLPGQDRELEIRTAIKEAAAVVVCLSSKWVNDRSYVQKQLKMILDVMGEMPEGQIFLIPVKLDECTVPQSMERLHWVNLFEPNGFVRLQRAIQHRLGSPSNISAAQQSQNIDAWTEFTLQRYREGVEWAWVDRAINRREVEWLRNLANEIGIAPSTVADVEREVMGETKEAIMERQEAVAKERYREAVKEAWTDKELTSEEVERLAALASDLDLSTDTTADIEREVAGGTVRTIREWQINVREQDQRLERERKVADLYQRGSRHMNAKEWHQALICLEEAAQLEPTYRNTRELLAQVRQQLTLAPEPRRITAGNIARVRHLRPPLKGEETTGVLSVAFSPDGKLLAAGEEGDERHAVELWSMEDRRRVLHRLVQHSPGKWVSVAFSPNGSHLAAGGPSRIGHSLEPHSVKVQVWALEA
jgi:hypothetical protein